MTVIVVHSTEGGPGTGQAAARWMISQRTISNEVFDPTDGELIPLVPWPHSARSLRNLPGGVQTNGRGGVYQIEVVGRAAQIPGYPDAWHRALAEHLVKTANRIGCPLEFPCEFIAYPSSYGNSRVRLSFGDWATVEGIIGHMHVPENDHGDPGDISKTIAHIRALTATDTGDDEMVLAKYMTKSLAMSRLEQVCRKHRDADMSIDDRRWLEADTDARIAKGEPIDALIDWWDAALYAENQ